MKHKFDVEVASAVGVHAAVIFDNIAFWIEHNRKAGKNEHEGVFWMYTTQSALSEQFDYLSVKQTRTAIEKLVAAGYLRIGRFNRHGYDRTSWYAYGEKGESITQNRQIDLPIKANETDGTGSPIPNKRTRYIKPNVIDKSRIEHIRRICGIT